MAAEARLLDVVLGSYHAVRGEHLAVFPLLLRHVALVALHPRLVVGAPRVGFRLRVLELDEACAGDRVPEVEEVELLVVLQ